MITNRIDAGWAELLCDYFRDVCVDVIGDGFLHVGFSWKETSIGGVCFFREDLFVELSYAPESYPKYSPTVIVGIGSDKYGVNGTTNGIPSWFVIPQDLSERRYSTWEFSDRAELAIVMEKIRMDVLDTYVMPLLKDKVQLSSLVTEFGIRK